MIFPDQSGSPELQTIMSRGQLLFGFIVLSCEIEEALDGNGNSRPKSCASAGDSQSLINLHFFISQDNHISFKRN